MRSEASNRVSSRLSCANPSVTFTHAPQCSQTVLLGEMALDASCHYGLAQDLEWGIDETGQSLSHTDLAARLHVHLVTLVFSHECLHECLFSLINNQISSQVDWNPQDERVPFLSLPFRSTVLASITPHHKVCIRRSRLVLHLPKGPKAVA